MFESISSISHFVFYYSQNRLCCVFYVCVCEPGTDVRPDVTQCDTHAQHSRGTHSFAADAFLIRDTETNNAAAAAGAAVSVAGFVVHIRCDDASLCVYFGEFRPARPGLAAVAAAVRFIRPLARTHHCRTSPSGW